jgi:hypothetical protein
VWAIVEFCLCLMITKCACGTRREFLRGVNLLNLEMQPQNEAVHNYFVKPLAHKWIQILPLGCAITSLRDFLIHDLKRGEQCWASKARAWGVWSSTAIPPQTLIPPVDLTTHLPDADAYTITHAHINDIKGVNYFFARHLCHLSPTFNRGVHGISRRLPRVVTDRCLLDTEENRWNQHWDATRHMVIERGNYTAA